MMAANTHKKKSEKTRIQAKNITREKQEKKKEGLIEAIGYKIYKLTGI